MFEEEQETVRGTVYPTNGFKLRMTRSAGRRKSTSMPSLLRIPTYPADRSDNIRPVIPEYPAT